MRLPITSQFLYIFVHRQLNSYFGKQLGDPHVDYRQSVKVQGILQPAVLCDRMLSIAVLPNSQCYCVCWSADGPPQFR